MSAERRIRMGGLQLNVPGWTAGVPKTYSGGDQASNGAVEKPCFQTLPCQNPYGAINALWRSSVSEIVPISLAKDTEAFLDAYPFPSNHFMTGNYLRK